MESLQQTITGCINNSNKDQKHLYERYYGYCLKIVFRYIYKYESAVDVVNDGFVKIFRKLYTFSCDNTANFEIIWLGWIKRIMINTAIDKLRNENFLHETGLTNESIWMEDKSRPADQLILYKELISEIKRLPPGYRAVFNMYIIDGFTHQEISNILGIAVGTSKSNLSKARAILQNFIKKNDLQAELCYT